MKGLVWSTTICDINIDNTNTRNNSSIIPNLPPQSWLTPWGYQIKPVPNSDELEEVILLHKKEFLDQKKIDLHHSQATTKWSKTHITTKLFSEHDTQHFQVAKEAFKQVRKTKSVQFGFDEHFWFLPNMAKTRFGCGLWESDQNWWWDAKMLTKVDCSFGRAVPAREYEVGFVERKVSLCPHHIF